VGYSSFKGDVANVFGQILFSHVIDQNLGELNVGAQYTIVPGYVSILIFLLNIATYFQQLTHMGIIFGPYGVAQSGSFL
jgi:hypothetical protein